MSDEQKLYGHGQRLSREDLRDWLDRKPPPKPPDEREWEEFEYARDIDAQSEAGHA